MPWTPSACGSGYARVNVYTGIKSSNSKIEMNIVRVGLDIAKQVFSVHGGNVTGHLKHARLASISMIMGIGAATTSSTGCDSRSDTKRLTCTPKKPSVRRASTLRGICHSFDEHGRSHEGLTICKEIFRKDRQIKHLSDEERLRARQERSAPPLIRFKRPLDNVAHSVQ